MIRTSDVTPQAFDECYRDLYPSMVRIAYLSLGARDVAEEVVQDAFLRLYERFGEVQNPGGFMRTAVTRLCINRMRRRSMETERLARVDPVAASGEPAIDETWHRLAAVSTDHRVVLVLRYYEDLSYAEIARIIGRPIPTARTRVARALRALRRELER